MLNKTKIRPITKKDIPIILMLEKLADISNTLKNRSVVDIPKILYNNYEKSKDYFVEKIKNSKGYVVIYDASIIACGFLIESLDKYEIQTVYVEPSFQNKGVGSYLVKFFIQKGKADGKKTLKFETATAQGFYSKLGFTDIPNTFEMVLEL